MRDQAVWQLQVNDRVVNVFWFAIWKNAQWNTNTETLNLEYAGALQMTPNKSQQWATNGEHISLELSTSLMKTATAFSLAQKQNNKVFNWEGQSFQDNKLTYRKNIF